ncbi:metal ABC transporter solute-binding protein, Zn/Mn family [Microbacterium aurantiacum]|uniref:Iron-binding protein n=1 Tax=Microbacterium aurantiacum TaxID=162393 RepID=A0A0M9VLW8_9MICO|nr:zinc ABC transporter substrate-binding protein [Microbacterium chocolatum]ANG84436.1 iron-binding protein [Microbacterium chocolatum]KOS11633.1 iron-binding protein [Microbacterium chocolatum]
MPKSARRAAAGVATAVVAALALAGCTPATTPATTLTPPAADDRPVVLTTFTVLQDIAQNVAGEHLVVQSLTKIGAEIHGYEPTPGDVRRAQDADLIIDNGLGLEAWFAAFTRDLDVPTVVASDGVETIAIAGGEAAGRVNPHAWMSPRATAIYVENIAAAFADLDPDNAAAYAANAETYTAELDRLDAELAAAVAAIPASERALVTCEGAFSYLARDAGLGEAYLWPVNAEQQATPRSTGDVIEYVRDRDVPAVFCESTVSNEAMLRVTEETDAAYGGTLYVDSLSEPDGPVPTYLDLMGHDLDVIAAGLTGGTGR